MSQEMDASSVQEAYVRWAKVYDWVFGPAFTRARRRAIELLRLKAGDRVIEVGVGTGLSLPLFPSNCRVVGADFSRAMLERAATRVDLGGNERAMLVEGDAGRLPFPDNSFDAALAPYVVSAAPDPIAVLHEMERVCRPGGKLVILNHFSSSSRGVAGIEQALSGITSKVLGFHAEFPLEPLFDRAEMVVEHCEKAPPLRFWRIVCCTARRDEVGTRGGE
jgi:phosphatidylethanolamine/phosphatidyl-N-methylethanolamine N-methyltransferase